MTTGRINQVTTFRFRFRGHRLLACDKHSLSRCGVHHLTFRVQDPWQLERSGPRVPPSNPQMPSRRFPFSHVPSEISFLPARETQGSPTDDEDYRRLTTDVAEPRVASCIRFDHRQATHLLQHRSSMSHKDSIRLYRQDTPRTDPLRAGFPRGGTHPLDSRRPSHPSKRPTREASKPGRSKPPFNL